MPTLFRSWLSLFIALMLLAFQPLHAAGQPDFLVDADWLAGEMKNPKLVVLEVRYHPHRYHTVDHIPGRRPGAALQGSG